VPRKRDLLQVKNSCQESLENLRYSFCLCLVDRKSCSITTSIVYRSLLLFMYCRCL